MGKRTPNHNQDISVFAKSPNACIEPDCGVSIPPSDTYCASHE